MRIYLILFFLLFSTGSLLAQLIPRNSQYLLNPFMYNPAFAGREGRYELHMNHHRQWIGINEAPVISSLSFHTGFAHGLALGMNAYNYTRGLVTTNSAQLAIGYHARFGLHHGVRLGLSGGFSSSRLDFSKVSNPNDPAVLTAFDNSMVSDGQFGINYHFFGLNLGVTLPSLLNKNTITTFGERGRKIDPFNSYVINADYQFRFMQNMLVLQPYLLYYVIPGWPAQWEGGSLLYIDNKVHIGGSYRQNDGPTALAGFRINKMVAVGYAYGFANQVVNSLGQGTHELQLSIRFGKVKSREFEKTEEPTPSEEKIATSVEKEKVEETTKPENEMKPAPADHTEKEWESLQPEPAQASLIRGTHPDELLAGYFVVVGVYSNKTNAGRYISELKEKGYQASSGYNSQTKYYYVYVNHTEDITRCRQIRDQYRRQILFQDAWMLEIK